MMGRNNEFRKGGEKEKHEKKKKKERQARSRLEWRVETSLDVLNKLGVESTVNERGEGKRVNSKSNRGKKRQQKENEI